MAEKNIFKAGNEAPQDIDTLSAPPKGFKHLTDASGRDPVEWAKTVITANFPAVTHIQIFHESKSDVGGAMIARFFYHKKSIDLPISNQKTFDTLTNREHQDLLPHIQRMTPFERGIFNTVVQHIKKLERQRVAIIEYTKTGLRPLTQDTQDTPTA